MDRRAFIGAAGWIVAPWSAWAAYRPPPPATRRLKLFNAHTGESFDGLYRDEHGPSTSAAAELAELLRDHHSGTIAPIDGGCYRLSMGRAKHNRWNRSDDPLGLSDARDECHAPPYDVRRRRAQSAHLWTSD